MTLLNSLKKNLQHINLSLQIWVFSNYEEVVNSIIYLLLKNLDDLCWNTEAPHPKSLSPHHVFFIFQSYGLPISVYQTSNSLLRL